MKNSVLRAPGIDDKQNFSDLRALAWESKQPSNSQVAAGRVWGVCHELDGMLGGPRPYQPLGLVVKIGSLM